MDFIHDFPLMAEGLGTDGGGSRGQLDSVLLQPSVTPCWEVGLLQPRLGSFLQLPHHFLPLPTTQAKAWPSEEDGEDTPTRSIPNSLRGPLPAFLVCCWLCSLEEGLNHDSSLSRSHSILRSRVPNPWYPFLFPFLGPSQSFWAAPSHSSLASFCLFPGTWSISTPSFSLSRQNFIHIW